MGELKILKCMQCGAVLDADSRYVGEDGYAYISCKYCKVTYMEETPLFSDAARDFYTQGKIAFDQQRFEDAITCFDNAIGAAKSYYNAYWYRLLADNGIEYVTDSLDGKRKPTCHRCSEKPLMEQNDFKNACLYAPSDEIRKGYYESASIIDEIRKSVLEQSKTGIAFDVFISFKKTEVDADGNDIEGSQTQDLNVATTLYNKLKYEYKLNVFFSEATLKNVAGANFEATIFRALDTAKVFILIGSKSEYVNARWVKNEWMRYLRMMKQGRKVDGSMLYVFADNIPTNISRDLSSRQALKFNDPDFYQSLMRAINRAIELSERGSRIARRNIKSEIETGCEVVSQLKHKNRDFGFTTSQGLELADKQKIAFVEDSIARANYSGAETMLDPLLQISPNNPTFNFLKMLVDEGIPGKEACIKQGAKDINIVTRLDSIIGLCGQNDSILPELLKMVEKIFYNACSAKKDDIATKSFTILCQCSNLTVVQNNMIQYVENMIELARGLFGVPSGGERSRKVFACMLDAIGLCDNYDEKEKSFQYAIRNFDYAMMWHKAGNFAIAEKYYAEAINYDPNQSRYYFSLWQAKRHISSNNITDAIVGDFGQNEVEKVLVHSKDDAERKQYIAKFAGYAAQQVVLNNIKWGNDLFEYIISAIPSDDVQANKGLILTYSEVLIQNGCFGDARKYLNELLKITSNKCFEAYWMMIFVDSECRSEEELVREDRIVNLQELPSYMNAYSCGDVEQQKKCIDINEKKLNAYEQSRVPKGFQLLKKHEYDEAKNVFNELFEFEKNVRRKKNGTDYPIAYWGIMLAELECESTEQLATLPYIEKYPDSYIQENPNYNKYKNYQNTFHSADQMRVQYYERDKDITKETDQIELLNKMRFEEATLAQAKAQKKAEEEAKLAKEKARSIRLKIGFVALLALVFATLAGASVGTYLFIDMGIAGKWFSVLRGFFLSAEYIPGIWAAVGIILGAVGAIIARAIYGFHGSERGPELDEKKNKMGLLGFVIGCAPAGLVFACCWALIPIVAVGIVVGLGFALNRIRDEI